MFTGFAAEHCGEIVYSDLDIADEIFQAVRHTAKIVEPEKISQRGRCGHKGIYGHVLLVGGDTGFLGAIRLSAEAALRSGAGLVSVATRKNHMNFINIMRPEVMSHGVESGEELDCLLNKASVVVIGPGLGQSLWAINLFEAVVSSSVPLVVDADALNLLAKQPVYRKNWVLTPHPGEAARLLNCSTQDIAANRFEAVSQMQAKYGGTVVLKGAGTLIGNGEQLYISTTGNPGMATGGVGDVLALMVASLVAQKWSIADAARVAVYNHGLAAALAAKAGGERGMLASDLMVYIRKLMN